MENIGALSILLAFCLAVYAVIGSVIGKIKKNPFLVVSGERATYCVWILLTTASGLLIYSLLTGDFRLGYVASHTDQTMPAIYKFTAWWGGQEGSFCCGPGCFPRIRPSWFSPIATSSAT